MISVEEALEKILQAVEILETEPVPILDSLGQVLAEDVHSDINVPPLDNSAMDGYAVRSQEIEKAGSESPIFLRVIDTVMAGSISELQVVPGTAVRIMTGAPVPGGADSVVQFENTDEEHRKDTAADKPIVEVGILCKTKPGENIRRAGEDIARGFITLRKGTVIRSAEIGLLASLGYSQVNVIRRPVVAVLATGNELVDINQSLPEGKIYNSNTYSIASMVKRYGCIPKILGIALDTEDELISKLRSGLDADMMITIGGVSMGDYDVVKDVLAAEGEMVFWQVRVKPGKPLAFGKLKGTGKKGIAKCIPHLGLPGNPVSCMVSFELFIRPALLKMMGKKNLTKPTVAAIMEDSITKTGERRIYDRAIIEKRDNQYFARLTGPQGSGILTSMSQANGLVIVPEDKPEVKKGETLQALMLDWNEEVNI
ncbi:gephyrin-like molybdotransferase Glp [Chloroflexota bacterium]